MKIESLSEWKARRDNSAQRRSRVCPACERETTFRPSRPQGLLERTLFALFGQRLFRCGQCGRRLRLPNLPPDFVKPAGARGDFLLCPDPKGFAEVIHELAQAERALEGPSRRRLSVIAPKAVRTANSSPQSAAAGEPDLTPHVSKS